MEIEKVSESLYCINHPAVETYLRCNRCGTPICARCAVRTEVGYRCPACIRRQQQVFYTDFRSTDYLIAAAVALPLGLVGGFIVPALGWFAIFLGPAVGLGIAEAAHRAIRRRRGPYTWIVIAGCILAGGLARPLWSFLPLLPILPNPGALLASAWSLVWSAVYLVGAVGTAVARLRPRRRR